MLDVALLYQDSITHGIKSSGFIIAKTLSTKPSWGYISVYSAPLVSLILSEGEVGVVGDPFLYVRDEPVMAVSFQHQCLRVCQFNKVDK